MADDSTLIGVYFATGVGLLFLLCHFRRRVRPDLGQFAAVFLAAVAATVAGYFGYDALRAASVCVAACKDQRLPMVLGAIAVEWIAVAQLWSSFYRVLTVEPPSASSHHPGRLTSA